MRNGGDSFGSGLCSLVGFITCFLGGLCQLVGCVAGLAVGRCQRFRCVADLLCCRFKLAKVFRAGLHDSLIVLHGCIGFKLRLRQLLEGFGCRVTCGFQLFFGVRGQLLVLHEFVQLVIRFLDGCGQGVMDSGRCFNGL